MKDFLTGLWVWTVSIVLFLLWVVGGVFLSALSLAGAAFMTTMGFFALLIAVFVVALFIIYATIKSFFER